MKRNLLLSILASAFFVVMAFGGRVYAYPSVGDDIILFHQTNGQNDGWLDGQSGTFGGGRFELTYGTKDDSTTWKSFKTFCVEENEYIFTDQWAYVYSISNMAIAGGNGGIDPSLGGDPISPQTAYLYTQFVNGAYDDLSLGGTTHTQYQNLQKAIWNFEEEGNYGTIPNILPSEEGSVEWFLYKAANSGWTDIGNVRVLNLFASSDGKYFRQDQLTMVPEPTTILLSGIGLLGMGIFLRRCKQGVARS